MEENNNFEAKNGKIEKFILSNKPFFRTTVLYLKHRNAVI